MCLREIIWRVRRLLWQVFARFRRRWRELEYQRCPADSQRILESIDKIKFYGLADISPKDVPQDWVTNTVAAAENLLQHRYSYLALGEIDLGAKINWNREYKRGIDTPLLFGPRMDYRDSKSYGDFKYFWELPRLQHLITLAKAYYLTGGEKYAKETVSQIRDFIEQSPYLLGVNWIMPMEASIRLISISWVTAFIKEYLKRDKHACSLIENIARAHVDYVTKNFSAYSSANNHLIAEAAGVFIASICFSKLDGMTKHKRNTYDILCREIVRQFYPDGVNREQTTHYHIACYNCFLLAALLGKSNGLDFPFEYWKILESSANFICLLANEDNSIPYIGDSDDGRTIVLADTENNPVQALLATAAVLFNRSDFKAKAKDFDEMSFWLFGKNGKALFDMMACTGEPTVKSAKFDEGGYYVLRSSGSVHTKLIFDCGPLGFGTIAAHGHADSLSFILYAHKQQFFIDPGTYTFIADNPYRNYFRSTAAHNTIVVDGQDQSQMVGPFLWTHKANSFVEEWISNEHRDKITGKHDGYHRLRDPVTHRRTIELDKDKAIISISDHIEARAKHRITQYFHLAPQCRVQKIRPNCWCITSGGKTIILITDERLDCTVIKGSESPICGWASRVYDQKEPINTLVCQGLSKGNQCFLTTIRLQCQHGNHTMQY